LELSLLVGANRSLPLNTDVVVTTLVVQLPQETTKVVTTNEIANLQ